MGISSSNERYHLFMLEHVDELEEVNPEEVPEKERDRVQAATDSVLELWWKELHALFPQKQGDPSGDTEMDENDQVVERVSDFIERGGCKDSFKALTDCMDDQDDHHITRCKDHLPILKKCMDAHIHYYEPILALVKTVEEKAIDEIRVLASHKEEEQKLAATNQAEG